MYLTEQEAFWAGEFGDEYIDRNTGDRIHAANLNLFGRVLSRAHGVGSVIEFGANVGNNLKAFAQLLPSAELDAIEINAKAADQLASSLPSARVHQQSILDFVPDHEFDLVLIKGVLIHINPDVLGEVYSKLYAATGRYLLVCEYYSPTPQEVQYRGFDGKLFKRDFVGELLQKYEDLQLVDYGFCYHNDPVFPMDDISWFLLERRPS